LQTIMKKFTKNAGWVLLLMLACASQKDKIEVTKQTPQVYPLIGTWYFKNPDFATTQLIFNDDATVVLADVDFKSIGTFTVNFNTNPIQLDIIWPDLGLVKTIIRFIDKNTMQLENNYEETDRAVEFSANSEYLIRAKE